MDKLKAKTGALLLATVFLFSVVSPVLAKDSSKEAELRQKLDDKKDARCQMLTTRVETRVAKYYNNKEIHLRKYKKLAEWLNKVATKLDAKGYDTTKVRADYKTLNEMITKAAANYDLFIKQLEESKQFTCGASQGAFAQAVKEANDQRKISNDDVLKIRNYYQTVVRVDVQALKDQKPKSASPSASGD